MSSVNATDEQLGRRALAGDREAFTELFGRHEVGLFNVSLRLTGNREDAADITQEAFLRVFARLDDLAGREVNLAAYLHRTARNLVYDRSAQGARVSPTDEVERIAGADETVEADPELRALIADQGSDVRAANARLPERHRLALALRELEDMSYEDIGRVLDITAGAVAQLLVRARNALRRELRLGQVDAEAMDAGCRARLGEIGALIDGELNADRAHVLSQHMELCPSCREARASFEQARVTYRAWLPLPLIGLGAGTARAAEARGLVRFSDSARRATPRLRRGAGGRTGGILGGRRRAAGVVGSGVLGVLLLFGAPTLVAVRSGSVPPPRAEAPATTTTVAAGAPAPAPPAAAVTTTAGADPPALVPAPAAGAGAAAAPPAVVIDPSTSPAPPPVVTVRSRATPRAPAPAPAAPPVSVAGTTLTGPPAAVPPPDPPARVPDPPTTSRTDTTSVPGTPSDPPPRPTEPGPNDPPPGSTRTDPTTTVRTDDVPPRGEF